MRIRFLIITFAFFFSLFDFVLGKVNREEISTVIR